MANWWFPARLDRIVSPLSVEVTHDGLLPAPTDGDEQRPRFGVGAAPGGPGT